ncbi:MAG TPA: enolase [Tepidisphaeraceae bacterium]|jgi:enolase|nr:enolase [Tepidisphaeraceae bacterium]
MPTIKRLTALEILDSRGRPTISATCTLDDGATATASIPSGASTGRAEAHELRDGDQSRYAGLGCLKAAANIEGPIAAALLNKNFDSQNDLDHELLRLDNTPDKSHLGANAILATSLSFARAAAVSQKIPFYTYFAGLINHKPQKLPRPTINLFSGGLHAGGQIPIQDILIIPASATTIADSLAICHAVYQSAAQLIQRKYQSRPLVADEGGLAPNFPSSTAMIEDAVESIERAGIRPGHDVSLAIDLASTHFHQNGRYHLDNLSLDSGGLIEVIRKWTRQFPIVSVEDGLSEDDWTNWPRLRQAIHTRALTLGDDLLCTNPIRIKQAVKSVAADALLLKVNQIGTLTEAAEALQLARAANWKITISARSGETEDNWLADLSVGWSANAIKVGSITRSERLAKYNRLLEIERETHWPVEKWPLS